jgi:ferredoxin-NADP reductase
LWIAAAGAVIIWRIALPLWRTLRYELRIGAVTREAPDIVSVVLTGRSLHRLPLQAGQFINVRFLTRPGWTRANPFSLSAAPNGHSLRITAKALGDGSTRLAGLQPGTRVLFEGPYGRLSPRARSRRRVLLVGAGVGITPLRALAEGLAYQPGEALLMQRYNDIPLFAAEFEDLSARRGLGIIPLPGHRRRPDSVLGPAARGFEESRVLRHWVPDVAERDVYICGPAAWATGVERLMAAAGVPKDNIHTESFGW